MKGIIFNLLEEVVTAAHGESTWDDLLEGAGLTGSYTSLGSYPDDELGRLLTTAGDAFGQTPDQILRWFGRSAMPYLALKYPHFFTAHPSSRSFILSLNTIIHPEVRKLYPGADVPVFDFDNRNDEFLLVGYRSPRRFCALAAGLIEGAAAQFAEIVTIDELQCMKQGAPSCELRVRFSLHEH